MIKRGKRGADESMEALKGEAGQIQGRSFFPHLEQGRLHDKAVHKNFFFLYSFLQGRDDDRPERIERGAEQAHEATVMVQDQGRSSIMPGKFKRVGKNLPCPFPEEVQGVMVGAAQRQLICKEKVKQVKQGTGILLFGHTFAIPGSIYPFTGGQVLRERFGQIFQGLNLLFCRSQGKCDKGRIIDVVGQPEVIKILHEIAIRKMPGRAGGIEIIGTSPVFVSEARVFPGDQPRDFCCFLPVFGAEAGFQFPEDKQGGGQRKDVVLPSLVVPERGKADGPLVTVRSQVILYFRNYSVKHFFKVKIRCVYL